MPTSTGDLFNAINRDKGLLGHFWISQCWDWRFDITRWDEILPYLFHYLYHSRAGRLGDRTMVPAHEATLWMLAQKVQILEDHGPMRGLNTTSSILKLYFTDLQAFHRTRTNARHKNHAQYWLEALWEMRGNRALLKDTFERLKNELNHAQENHLYKKITHFTSDTPRGQFCRAVRDDQNNSEGFNVDIRKDSGHVFNLGYIARLAEQNHFKDFLMQYSKEYGSGWSEFDWRLSQASISRE